MSTDRPFTPIVPARRHFHALQRLGVRAQLTVLYTAVFALLFLVVAAAYYAYLDRTLRASFDATLTLRTAQIAAGVSQENGTLNVQDVTGELPLNVAPSAGSGGAAPSATATPTDGGPTGNAQVGAQQTNTTFGTLVRIVDAGGTVAYVSRGFSVLPVPAISVREALAGNTWLGTVTAPDGSPVRVESIPLQDTGNVYGVLQVGAPATELDATLRTAGVALFGATLILLFLGAVGSYWLARRALRPVLRLTRSARLIEAEGLHRRVPVPLARDEIHELAETLNGMIGRLERAFTQQQRFVSDASHELRTPVAAIQSLTDVALAQPGDPDDYADVLRAVNSEAERLGNLIGDLLALARADEGKLPLASDVVRLDDIALDVVGVVGPLAAGREVQLQTEVTPVTVLGDDARLIEMLLNLVDNAVRYTPAGGTVTVTMAEASGLARIVVRDTGQGIAPEHLPHIFERFYRADPARTPGQGGTGLGLSIVEWVVRAHGGQITVESQVGAGTVVTVTLPLAGAAAQRDGSMARRPEGQSALM